MLFAIAAVVLTQFPVELPRELGHLRLMSSKATDKGVEIELEYQNVTELTFSTVSIECTVFDHRDVAVSDEYKVLNNDGQGLAPGARLFAKLVVTDHVSRGRRAECAVARANKAKVQLASAPAEEMLRTPIVRERPAPIPAPTVTTPVPEAVEAPKPIEPATAKPPAPTEPQSKLPPQAPVTTPAPAPVSAPPPAKPTPAPMEACCKKCGGATKACGDSCIPINQKCREWTGCACTVE